MLVIAGTIRIDPTKREQAATAAPHMADFQATIGTLGVKEMNLEKYEIASVGPVF